MTVALRETGERRARRIVGRRSGGWCEACDRYSATDWHHRLNRSQGGLWCPSNGMHLCRTCHHLITTEREVAKERGWALEPHQVPTASRCLFARIGYVLLSPAGDVTPVDTARWHW